MIPDKRKYCTGIKKIVKKVVTLTILKSNSFVGHPIIIVKAS